MSEINWNDNAKGAIAVFYDFLDEQGMSYAAPDKMKKDFFEWLEPTQTKTVADACEWVMKGNKICGYSFAQNKMLSFCKDNNTYAFVSETSSAGSVETENWQPICTREQFEAYAKEQEAKQEGEKWTHMHSGVECFIKVNEPDCDGYLMVETKGGRYLFCTTEQLKPIKPKLTEDAMKAVEHFAYSLMEKESYSLEAEVKSFRDNHEIIQL